MTEQQRTVEVEIQDELGIDETKLEEELVRQSSKYFYWSTMWARAAKARRRQQLKLRELEATITQQYRATVAVDDPKLRVTERMVEDYLSKNPDYKQEKLITIEKEYAEDMLSVAKDGFRQRGQALIELIRLLKDDGKATRDELEIMRKEMELREQARKEKRRSRKEIMPSQEVIPNPI
jgi:hypothetical protein